MYTHTHNAVQEILIVVYGGYVDYCESSFSCTSWNPKVEMRPVKILCRPRTSMYLYTVYTSVLTFAYIYIYIIPALHKITYTYTACIQLYNSTSVYMCIHTYTLNCIPLYCTALHNSVANITVHYMSLNYITLHSIAWHCITLHYKHMLYVCSISHIHTHMSHRFKILSNCSPQKKKKKNNRSPQKQLPWGPGP